MTNSSILYLLGMLLLFIGERQVGGDDPTRWLLDGTGLAAIAGALALLFVHRRTADGNQRRVYTSSLTWAGLGLASLAVYGLSTDTALDALALDDQAEQRFVVVITSLWILLWLIGTLPFLFLSRALAEAPVRVSVRAPDAAITGLATALGLSLLLPLNYLASDTNERWDLGYFRTADPGTRTLSIVQNLEDPVRAVLFFPVSSDVTEEIRTYFDQLKGYNLEVEYVDHALEPELAKELKVRDNGYIAFARGEQVERLKVGKEFDKAKRILKKLDTEVQTKLSKIAQGQRTAYLTVGHGELYWSSSEEKDRALVTFKKVLKTLNYKIEELGLAQGLSNEVPGDADLVIVMGPTETFLEGELEALAAYRDQGGALLLSLEPDGPDFSELLGSMGLKLETAGSLASDKNFVLHRRGKVDRTNIVTNKFSTHDSVTTLSRNSKVFFLITPSAGSLVEEESDGVKTTVTVRSLPEVWMDVEPDLDFGASEQRKTWNLAAAVTTEGEEGDGSRAVVIADANWASDLFLGGNKGNFQLLIDSISWLVDDETSAGTINSEEDVKIQHTREGQGLWFYSTAFLVPVGLLSLGMFRVRSRKKRGGS